MQDNKNQENAGLELLDQSQNTCPFHRDKELARAFTLHNVIQEIFVNMISLRSNSSPALYPNCRGLTSILHLCYFKKKKDKLILRYSNEKEPDTSQKIWVGYSVKKDACCFSHRREGKNFLPFEKPLSYHVFHTAAEIRNN